MWQSHRDRWFPPLLRGAEVGDVDVVLLDSDTAGCVSTWLSNGGHLDTERTRILAACVKDLDAVLAVFTDGDRFWELVTAESLPFERKDVLGDVLRRGRINNAGDHEVVVDLLVVAQQEGKITAEEAARLSKYIGQYENRGSRR